MPSKYKLTYFNLRARGEVARNMFILAGVEFEDNRVEFPDWPALKPKTEWGALPELEVDGGKYKICQSDSIARYLAKEFGLLGKTNEDAGFIDMLSGCMTDLVNPFVKIRFEEDEALKAKLSKAYEETLANGVARLEGFLNRNNGGNGFFVGGSVTLADACVYNYLKMIETACPDVFKKSPKLAAHAERYEALPKIAEWLKKRPANDI